MIGKSSCSSVASSAAKRSKHSLTTSLGRASGLSTLLTQTIGFRPIFSALPTTNLVCGIGPSAASTSTIAPSTIDRMRSTSPPKSAWPGVSTMLMRDVLPHDRGRLGEDGDAALALEIVRIHHPLGDALVVAKGARLLQEPVDQRRLAVVDVGDDGDVAELHHGTVLESGGRRGGGGAVLMREDDRDATARDSPRFPSVVRRIHERSREGKGAERKGSRHSLA